MLLPLVGLDKLVCEPAQGKGRCNRRDFLKWEKGGMLEEGLAGYLINPYIQRGRNETLMFLQAKAWIS